VEDGRKALDVEVAQRGCRFGGGPASSIGKLLIQLDALDADELDGFARIAGLVNSGAIVDQWRGGAVPSAPD
jgi:hypothetical protein